MTDGTLRVAVLGSSAVNHTGRWAAALVARGIDVRVWTLEPPRADDPARERTTVLPAAPVPMFLRYPLATGALKRGLQAFDPHLVDAHFVPNYGLMGALVGRHPLVVNAWGSDLLRARDPLRRARVRFVLSRADHVRVDAHNLARAARRLGAREERLEILPWGTETKNFPFAPDRAARLAARRAWPEGWGEAGEGPIAVSTRMLHPIYAVDTLVNAWPHVVNAIPDARCFAAGDGPLRAALEVRARALGVAGSLRFIGRQSAADLARLLSGADAYVSTSLSDSTSLSLLEAMSAGAYPVVSAIEGNKEWVGDDTAFLFPPNDAGALARGLVRVLGDSARFDPARAQNRAVIEERGDWERAMDRVAERCRALVLKRWVSR
ncbi:MAG TPA: glycosyltransferase family 4 protein [Candidatus Eisenbacteria bacterium]|jgi:glycosyltransferase involved in cell wall biosynthesis|nr:glycosyltransferase family 4 protein [Candidatus Eisenbacteria bacterium]